MEEIDKPVVTADRVLVRVRAASVNPADMYTMRGPIVVRTTGDGFLRPKNGVQGGDLAGTVSRTFSFVFHYRVTISAPN